jgi:hypothetical protein
MKERIIQNKKYNSQFNEVDNNFHFSYFISQYVDILISLTNHHKLK